MQFGGAGFETGVVETSEFRRGPELFKKSPGLPNLVFGEDRGFEITPPFCLFFSDCVVKRSCVLIDGETMSSIHDHHCLQQIVFIRVALQLQTSIIS